MGRTVGADRERTILPQRFRPVRITDSSLEASIEYEASEASDTTVSMPAGFRNTGRRRYQPSYPQQMKCHWIVRLGSDKYLRHKEGFL